MMLLSLFAAFLCAIATSEAADVHQGRLARIHRNAAAVQSKVLARRHQDYTGKQLVKRGYSGRATYYAVGLGACGWYSSSSESVVALAESVWNQKDDGSGNPNNNGWCGQEITISYGGIQKQATIVDLCPVNGGCLAEDGDALDLSESLFSSFAALSLGVFQMEWWPNDGSNGGSNTNSPVTATADSWSDQSADAAAAAASSSEAAAWAAAQSSSSAAAAWAAAQSSSSAAAAAASSRSHEAWVSWNSVMSTSWEGVLRASRSSEASAAAQQSVEAAASREVVREAKASRASVRSEASAAASRSSAVAAKETGDNKQSQSNLANTKDATSANGVSQSSLEAIYDVSLRLANLVSIYVADVDADAN